VGEEERQARGGQQGVDLIREQPTEPKIKDCALEAEQWPVQVEGRLLRPMSLY
jgi:hypothetical protein